MMMHCVFHVFCCVFLRLLIVAFRKNERAAGDACWLACVTVTCMRAYVRSFFLNVACLLAFGNVVKNYLILCTDWLWYWLTMIFYRQTSAFLLFTILLCIILSTVWWWLTMTDSKSLVIVLSVLSGWVPLYWRTYQLISDTECVRRPNRLMHTWASGIAVADWYVRNRRTCSHGPVRLLLSSSDGLWSEESDHINVLAGQAASKPH